MWLSPVTFTNKRSRGGRVNSSLSNPGNAPAEFLYRQHRVCIFYKVMKKRGSGVVVGLLLVCSYVFPGQPRNLPASFDYTPLERVLQAYVDDAGFVNYTALKQNRADLDHMIQQIAQVSPANGPQLFPTHDAQLAYWINAYNALIIGIVADHYPT